MKQLILFIFTFYVGTGLLVLIGEIVKKKSVRFSSNEVRLALFKTAGYGTIVLVAAYIYYFMGVKTE